MFMILYPEIFEGVFVLFRPLLDFLIVSTLFQANERVLWEPFLIQSINHTTYIFTIPIIAQFTFASTVAN